MDDILPLPAREALLPGESLLSLIRRTSNAMGYDNLARIRSLLKDVGEFPAHFNHLRSESVWHRLAKLSRYPTETIKQATVHRYAEHLMVVADAETSASWCDSKAILRYFNSAHPPVCPLCLAEDETPYERLVWSLRALPVCLRHEHYLVSTCPRCERALRPERMLVSRCRCGFEICNATTSAASAAAAGLVKLMAKWLEGKAPPLKSCRSCANVWWLERLAAAVSKTPDWMHRISDSIELPQSLPKDFVTWLAAADILDNWPDMLSGFLDVFQKVAKHRTTGNRIARSFGLLLREAKFLEDLGYAAPADVLRNYLIEHYTAGQLTKKICLFNKPEHESLLRQRAWISLTEAERLLALRKNGAVALIERGILEGKVDSANSGTRTVDVVSRDSVEQLSCDLKTAYSVLETSKQLGLGRTRVYELIKSDFLPRAVWATTGWRVPKSSVEALRQMIRQLPVTDKPTKNWLTMRQATRRFGRTGLTLVGLLRLIEARQVRAKRLAEGDSFGSLLLSATDLVRARPTIEQMRDAERGYPLNRLARTLFPDRPMKEGVLKKWIEQGLLRAKRSGRIWMIPPDEIERFRAEYCLFNEAESLLQIHNNTLQRWVTEGELTPVYGPRTTPGAGLSLYRRADVEALRDFIRSHHRKWRGYKSAA